mgnify:CR=1 FL=1
MFASRNLGQTSLTHHLYIELNASRHRKAARTKTSEFRNSGTPYVANGDRSLILAETTFSRHCGQLNDCLVYQPPGSRPRHARERPLHPADQAAAGLVSGPTRQAKRIDHEAAVKTTHQKKENLINNSA